MLTKKTVINVLRSLKDRGDISSRSWSSLLEIPQDAYNNAIYKDYLSDENFFTVVKSLDKLVKSHFIDFNFDEMRMMSCSNEIER